MQSFVDTLSQDAEVTSQLKVTLQLNNLGKTIVTNQYANFPLCLSRPFYLDNQNRAYLYLGNTSPGLFPKDNLNFSLDLQENTKVYLTDRAATKVYPTPNFSDLAQVCYQFNLAAGAYLEFVPESLILYQDAALSQITKINLDSSSTLFLSEIILPGRLAKGEFYQFQAYYNRLQVYNLKRDLLFSDGMYLSGKNNNFKDNHLFTIYPVLGNAIAVLPQSLVKLLQTKLEKLELPTNLLAASSLLPGDYGLLIRVNAQQTALVKRYFRTIINLIRDLTQDTALPYIPK